MCPAMPRSGRACTEKSGSWNSTFTSPLETAALSGCFSFFLQRWHNRPMTIHRSPLADRMRPQTIAEFVGQQHLVAKGKTLYGILTADHIPSMILWGPPGSGKTTFARLIARETKARFEQLSAVTAGVKDIKSVIERAEQDQRLGERTILFIDEIHRFNKAQQDALLPHVERGTVTFIGATTENPSFAVNSALLSRCRVFVFNALDANAITRILARALADRARGLGDEKVSIGKKSIDMLAQMANGDARVALNALELAALIAKKKKDGTIVLTHEDIAEAFQRTHLLYDRAGEEHYNIISALHKSMRGGDADAALYWLGRMLEAGEDPLYVARRLIRFASEDIGIANSLALPQAVACYDACHHVGMPECELNLAQAVVYMARSKKSNALYMAYGKVKNDIRDLPNEPVPLHLRNAPTKLMKNLGYGKGYKYTPEYKNRGDAQQDYLPKKLKGRKYLLS